MSIFSQVAAVKILVQGDCKEKILEELRTLGVGWDSLFGDLDHVAKEIMDGLKYQQQCK
jgi:hypothetical protein